MERIERVKEEFKASQEKESANMQECQEVETKIHSLMEVLGEEDYREREKLEGEERKKIAKEKRKVERRLKKITAKTLAAPETIGTSN